MKTICWRWPLNLFFHFFCFFPLFMMAGEARPPLPPLTARPWLTVSEHIHEQSLIEHVQTHQWWYTFMKLWNSWQMRHFKIPLNESKHALIKKGGCVFIWEDTVCLCNLAHKEMQELYVWLLTCNGFVCDSTMWAQRKKHSAASSCKPNMKGKMWLNDSSSIDFHYCAENKYLINHKNSPQN